MSYPESNDWRQKQEEIVIRVTRLFFKTGGRGRAWERLEALVAELEPGLLDPAKDYAVIQGGKARARRDPGAGTRR